MLAIMADLMSLIESEIPEGRQSLKDSHTNLEKVAEYCETNYFGVTSSVKKRVHYIRVSTQLTEVVPLYVAWRQQTLTVQADNKRAALEETKNFTTQSLASVAYQINTLAYNVLHLLDLQTTQLAEMESHISHISQRVNRSKNLNFCLHFPHCHVCRQTVNIHKEKVARREIGVLTTNKNTTRQHKIMAPASPERPIKYIRKPIDYSILDDIGHGVKSVASRQAKRSLSHVNGGVAGPAPTTKPPTPPQSVRSLSRGSKEYRTPVAPPQVPSNYASNYPLGHRRGSGYSTLPLVASHGGGGPQVGMVHPMTHHHTLRQPPSPPPPPPGEAMRPTDTLPGRFHVDDGSSCPAAVYLAHTLYNLPLRVAVIAIYDYTADKEDELSFSENSVIYVIKKNDDGWYEGVINGTTGLFPGNYVEPCM
ncbi:ABI2 [Cordylochernes scorpioides]|uniref:ABI2 n=1 Tax=Cordylochernes scorpioides TaxID=51811 RepID=A0ABY6KBQ8_9ARAC|nr:ABI2 [Cordylochernes scorpioides]